MSFVGLLLSVGFEVPFSTEQAIICIFPFLGRAYGFISSFFILMLLMPFLLILNTKLELRAQTNLLIILIIVFFFCPSLFTIVGWKGDYVSYFIVLFLVAGYASKCKRFFSIRVGLVLWFVSTVLLILSPFAISILGHRIKMFQGREGILYHYNSILVLGESVGLFMVFGGKQNGKRTRLCGALRHVASSSLLIYLLHMHPIFKNRYVLLFKDNGLLSFWDKSFGIIYCLQVMGMSLLLCGLGLVLSAIIKKPLKVIIESVTMVVQNKLRIEDSEK